MIIFAYNAISQKEETDMPTNEMDYFDQKPELDLSPFFKAKGMRLADPIEIARPAPPPKDTYWCATPDNNPPEQE